MMETFAGVLVGLLGCCPGLLAQQPAPAVEVQTSSDPAPAAAHMAALARWIGDNLQRDDPTFDRHLQALPADYRALLAQPDAVGRWQLADAHMAPSAEQLCYFVPRAGAPEPQLLFCVRGDGAVAFSHNEQHVSGDGEREPVGDAVFGAGGRNGRADFPVTPTRGNDGNLWLPLSMLPAKQMRVTVVDEHGAALPGTVVRCMPWGEGGSHGYERALPAGIVTTDQRGVATIVGLPAPGLGFVVVEGREVLPVTGDDVRFAGDGVQLRVALAAVRVKVKAANEAAAIATLKNISSAQAQCQASGVIDANANGAGEYGTFAELSGVASVRGGEQKINPPVLSFSFSRVANGVVFRSGYYFAMVLPGEHGAPIGENARGGADGLAIDADLAERHFCCYAWPLQAGRSGDRAFVVTAAGDVLACANADGGYSGVEGRPALDAVSAVRARIDGGVDQQRWVLID